MREEIVNTPFADGKNFLSKHRPLLALLVLLISWAGPKPTHAANLWEGEIARFEKLDQANPPVPDGIVFVGSSSIRLWDLKKSFPEHSILNRGFGGSQASDAVHFVPRIVVPYRPRLVVFYSGDNDLAFGKSPASVGESFAQFVRDVHSALPEAKIILLSIKPSPARAQLADQQKQANELIQRLATPDGKVLYLDVGRSLRDKEGRVRADLFLADGLHLNEEGYRLWSDVVRPYLKP